MSYYIEYSTRRPITKLFRKTDVYSILGYKDVFYPDSTYGNGGDSEVRKNLTTLDEFFTLEEAEIALKKWQKYGGNK